MILASLRPARPRGAAAWTLVVSTAVILVLCVLGLFADGPPALLGLVPSVVLWREVCAYLRAGTHSLPDWLTHQAQLREEER